MEHKTHNRYVLTWTNMIKEDVQEVLETLRIAYNIVHEWPEGAFLVQFPGKYSITELKSKANFTNIKITPSQDSKEFRYRKPRNVKIKKDDRRPHLLSSSSLDSRDSSNTRITHAVEKKKKNESKGSSEPKLDLVNDEKAQKAILLMRNEVSWVALTQRLIDKKDFEMLDYLYRNKNPLLHFAKKMLGEVFKE